MQVETPKPETVLVLGGGGGRGAAQLGILRALAARGTRVDACVGTSVGALNASVVAGRDLPEAVELLERIWASPQTRAVFRTQRLRVLVNQARRRPWLRSGDAVRELIRWSIELSGQRTFEDLRLPLHIVLTDLLDGSCRVVTSGELLQPLCASAAVPGMYPPVRVDGRLYIDGGVVDNCSIATAAALQPTRIIAIDLSAAVPSAPRRIGEVVDRVMSHALHARLLADYERFRERCSLTLLCARPRTTIGERFADFASLRDIAYAAADAVLQRISEADGALQPGMYDIPVSVEPAQV